MNVISALIDMIFDVLAFQQTSNKGLFYNWNMKIIWYYYFVADRQQSSDLDHFDCLLSPLLTQLYILQNNEISCIANHFCMILLSNKIIPFLCCNFWTPVKWNVASQFGHVHSVITINPAISRLQSVSLTLQINGSFFNYTFGRFR